MPTTHKKKKAVKKPAAKKAHCWEGYKRTPGTKAGAKGSCRKKKS